MTCLQCPSSSAIIYRAKLALGERDAAFEGAADLWNVGQSQERACDPLFEAWIAAVDRAMRWCGRGR